MSHMMINDVNFYYELFGDGQTPIVFIPGYRGDHHLWTNIAAAFSPTHKILLFDNQASGNTQDQGEPLTAWSMAKNLYALIERLGLERPIVVGYAMGGNIAQALAILFPDKIRQLFLISTAHRWSQYAAEFLDQLYENRKANRLGENISLLYDACFAKEYKLHHPLEEYRKMFENNLPIQTLSDEKRQISVLQQFDASELLGKIQAPTVVISPQEEKLATVEEATKLAEKIGPHAQQVILPNCGHAALLEKPQEIIEILKENMIA